MKFESLEVRELMATDLAQIVGDVLNDSGQALAAQVQLYRDNGNGVFSQGADTLLQTTTNDTAGRYAFTNLSAGTYFVRTVLANSSASLPNSVSSLVTITADEADGSVNLNIDNFTGAQSTSITRTNSTVGSVSNSSADGPNAQAGGVRDLFTQITANLGAMSLDSGFLGDSLINLQSSAAARGIARVVWDGADGSGTTVNRNGLNLDLSQGGLNSGLLLSVAADSKPNSTVTVRLSSDDGHVSTVTKPITDQDGTIDGDAGEQLYLAWSEFTATAGGGVNLADIGAIEIEFDFSNGQSDGLDLVASLVGALGKTTKEVDFTLSPKLSLGDLVWIDRDNDGMYMAGETVKSGVTLNLYRDSNGSGSYEAGVDTYLESTVTDSNGRYLFDDLMPGEYLVQVPETMFATGAPLNGYFTSTGNNENGMAPDPDANTDNKDKGTVLSGQGVVSKAITLLGFTEPVNDGDQDSTSNLTVDFGFYCIDIAVDKSVSATTAKAGDSLIYTITVTNVGQSRATGVGMTDVLPAGVTYTGSSGTLPPASVSGQTLTYFLGDFEPGQSRVYTVVTAIAANATGTLKNSVSVAAAEQELTLVNNMDMVTTTLSTPIPIRPQETISRLSKRRFMYYALT